MSIEVTCDECGRDFRVSDDKAGRRVRCSCGAAVRVPDEDDFEEAVPRRRSGSGRRKKSGGDDNASGLILGGLVGGGGLIVLIVVGMMLFRPQANQQLAPPPQPMHATPTVPNQSAHSTTTAIPQVIPTTPATIQTTPNTTTTTPTTPTTPTVNPAVPAAGLAVADSRWQALEAKYQVSHDGKDAKIAIAPGGKFVVIDRIIYDTTSGNEVWKAPSAFGGGDKKDLQALSPDGNLFAEGDEAGKTLTVASKEKIADETKRELPVPNGASHLTFLQFIDDKRIVGAWTIGGNSRVAVFDIEKPKKPVKDFNAETFAAKSGAISSDGKYLAVASTQALKVYDLAKGVSVATMATPAAGPLAFNGCSGLAFSPDNEEIAAVLGTTLFIWSNRGKLQEEYGGATTLAPFYKFNGLYYLPDKSGWFIHGQTLFDRARKMAVWQLQPPRFYEHPANVFDADHVMVSGGSDNNGQVAVVKIPREDLAKATKAIEEKVESVLTPGGSISIVYEVGEPRFANRQEVTNELHTILTARLKDLGMTVADNQPVTLKVIYTETAGETIEFRDFGPRFGQVGPRTNTKVTDTNTRFTATLTRKDDQRTWWTTTIQRRSPHIINGDATDQNVRNEAFRNLKGAVGAIDLPGFLPVNSGIPALPMKSDLSKL